MYTVKWSVLQYVIIRPAVTITGIICEVYGVLCESGGFNLNSVHFANIYLQFIDFISISYVSDLYSSKISLIVSSQYCVIRPFVILWPRQGGAERPKTTRQILSYQTYSHGDLLSILYLHIFIWSRACYSCHDILDSNKHCSWLKCARHLY